MLFPWQIAITLVAGTVTLALACVGQTQRKNLVANPFSLACLFASFWCFIYAWQVQASTVAEKTVAIQLGYSLVPFLPLITLEFCHRFVYERRLLRGWLLAATLVIPVITVGLAWTINHSPIFRYDGWVDPSNAVTTIRFKNGPWLFVLYAYMYGVAIWSFVILLRGIRSAPPWARRARWLIVIVRIIPMAFDLLFHWQLLPPTGMNYAPASIALADIAIAFIIFGDRFGYRAYMAHSTLVEKIHDLLIVVDRKDRILDMNRSAEATLGMRLETVQGQPAPTVLAAWPEILAQPSSSPTELERDGKCYELNILPVEAEARILWLRDITLRKRAERGYQAAAIEAREATEAKDRYLAVMSHEIRSPLNSVLGFMRLLESTSLDTEQREYVDHVASSGHDLLAVINDVLDYSKVEAGRMPLAASPFDLRDEVTKICRTLEIEAREKGLSFQCVIAPNLPASLVGDRVRIGQILRNLASNAVKFTEQGSVSVTVDCLPGADSHVEVRLIVADTGIGISSSEMASLFQPFSQATNAIHHRYGGTGLGLVIAKRLSNLMGGDITVQSAPSGGSTFTCSLLLTVDDGTASPGVSDAETDKEIEILRPLRILVVDDQPVNRRLLQIMLAKMQHETATASDGAEALTILRSQSFDAVILDIEMPGMDGFEAARQIHQMAAPPRLIALTAHASTDIREQCLAAGMQEYLSKPITLSTLHSALAAVRPGVITRPPATDAV